MNEYKVEEKDLLNLLHWARRYCDSRSTYVALDFNRIYDRLMENYDSILEKDQKDETLKDFGRYWPYAQDREYDEKTGKYNAIPIKSRKL